MSNNGNKKKTSIEQKRILHRRNRLSFYVTKKRSGKNRLTFYCNRMILMDFSHIITYSFVHDITLRIRRRQFKIVIYKRKFFFSFKMHRNCSQSEISIIGDGNIVYFDESQQRYNGNCRSFHSTFLTDVMFLVFICTIFISCISCCYCRRKKSQSQAIIDNDQFFNQQNINKC